MPVSDVCRLSIADLPVLSFGYAALEFNGSAVSQRDQPSRPGS